MVAEVRMRAMKAMRALLAAAVLVTACQTYDFEPMSPRAIAQTTQSYSVNAHQLKPDMMILLDKSGSMGNPLTPSASCVCTYGGNASCNETTCPTRMGQMKTAMGQFLMNSGRVARTRMKIFKTKGTCVPCSMTMR